MQRNIQGTTDYKSPFDQAKYNFTKRLAIVTTIILFLLGISYFIQDDLFFLPVAAGSVFAAITYFIITRTKKIRLAGIFAILSIDIIIVSKFLIESHFHYFEDFFWIVCLTLFAFFVLGKLWGILTLISNMLFAYFVFLFVRLDLIELIERPFKTFDEVNFALNLIIGSYIFITIVVELIRQNRISEEQYLSTYKELEIEHQEKTVMLREIHHRVKNNLQIITSLLRLQAGEVKNPQLTLEFSEAIDRISAIAKIHDKMYNNKSLNQIDLKEYLESLVHDILQSYTSTLTIQTNIESSLHYIKPKDLVPIALIFNELLTNSIKHAFKNKNTGMITINIAVSAQSEITITYTDNGKWIERDVKSTSIGLELIDSFIDQLDGQLKFDKEPKTRYQISFVSRD